MFVSADYQIDIPFGRRDLTRGYRELMGKITRNGRLLRRIGFFALWLGLVNVPTAVLVASDTPTLSETEAASPTDATQVPTTKVKRMPTSTKSEFPQSPAVVRVVEATDAGRLTFEPLIHCRDGGTSGLWQGRSIWLFGDTVTTRPAASGLNWLSNTACFIDSHTKEAANHADGLERLDDSAKSAAKPVAERARKEFARMELSELTFTEISERTKVPEEFIPWTAEEKAFNSLHFTFDVPGEKRERFAIWPGPLVASADDQSALVFFANLTAGPNGAWDFHGTGRSIAVWRDFDQSPERAEILFSEEDIQLGDAACRVDETVYAYGCQSQTLSWPMLLGRVAFDQANDRKAWEFYAGNGCWSKNANDAVSVFDGAPMASVHYNAAFHCFLAVYTQPLANRLVLRTAPAPEGPWSAAVEIAPCLPTTFSIGCYAGVAHPEFARENGQVEFVTYYRETGFFQGEIRVVKVRLAPSEP